MRTGKIATSYNLTAAAPKAGAKDVRGVAIDHDFIERETFVIGKDHKIIATLSSTDDNLSPDQHVTKVIGDRAAARLQIARQSIGKLDRWVSTPYGRLFNISSTLLAGRWTRSLLVRRAFSGRSRYRFHCPY